MRVLVVDDSVVFRSGISQALQGFDDIEVVGSAANGRIALQKIAQLKPDLIVLDLEMPELDGMGVITELRKSGSKVFIIVFSDQSEIGARKALAALSAGADDFIAKSIVKAEGDSVGIMRSELVPKIRQFFRTTTPSDRPQIKTPLVFRPKPTVLERPKLILIGSSTGGPEALRKIFSGIKSYQGPPILIVQHMPPVFTLQLAKLLSGVSGIPVHEAKDSDIIKQGNVYIAPGDFHVVFKKHENGEYKLLLTKTEKVKSVRPAADVLFKSVATEFEGPVWAFVLTGMGEDGLDGVKELKTKNTRVFIQDEASSIVWGMPGAIAKEGLQDKILNLDLISKFLIQQEEQ